jgi:phage tail sheath gpL-like
MRTLLNDVSGRWSWSTQIYGHFFAAYEGTFGALTTFGTARNDPHGSIMGVNDSPTPSWIWAAGMAGAAAVSLRADPNLPLQTIPIMGVLAPPLQSRFQLTDRNTLLFDGISTFTVGDDGQVYIENMVTTYQKNAFGNPDDSYLQVERMFLIAFVLRRLKTVVTSKYARMKLVENGTRLNPGVRAATPNMIRADLIAQYSELEGDAYVQRSDLFAKELIVEKSGANRVNVLWPGTLVDGLRIFALLFQFRTQ